MIIYTYINDTMSSLLDKKEEKVKQKLEEHYNIKTMEEVDYIIEIKISKCKSRLIPLSVEIILLLNNILEKEREKEKIRGIPYYEVLELLMWLQMETRPDLSFAVNLLFYFASSPGKLHWKVIKYTITYVKDTIDYRITYYYNVNLQPIGFVNSDYTNNYDIRR